MKLSNKKDKIKFYTNRKNIVILAVLSCILWGSAYPSIKIGYKMFSVKTNDIPSKLIFAGYRFALAGVIVLLWLMLTKKSVVDFNKKQLGQITILGFGQTALQYMFFYIGMSYTTGVRASIINATGTFVSILLAHFMYKNDKLNYNKMVGCVIGFIGVVIVNLDGQTIGRSSFHFYGEGFIMIAATIFAFAGIYGKRITQNIEASAVTGYQLFIGGIILTVLGYILGGHLHGFTLISTLLLIYMALISSVAFVIWTELLKFNKVGVISVFNFLVPVFGTILSAMFLGENIFNIKILLALILVSYGIYMVYRKGKFIVKS